MVVIKNISIFDERRTTIFYECRCTDSFEKIIFRKWGKWNRVGEFRRSFTLNEGKTMIRKMFEKEPFRIWKALGYSLAGLKVAIRGEAAFQTEVLGFIISTPLILWLPVDVIRKVFVIQSMVLVLAVELINVAIESGVNYISEERHPLAKKIKDVASASVFVCLLNSLGMWIWALDGIFGFF